eukprot:NODE_14_length_42432_cov_0.433799.p14 type:complete len:340 gc:universal NODE_14_length_42432_cov_0.433799:19969-20988(+)
MRLILLILQAIVALLLPDGKSELVNEILVLLRESKLLSLKESNPMKLEASNFAFWEVSKTLNLAPSKVVEKVKSSDVLGRVQLHLRSQNELQAIKSSLLYELVSGKLLNIYSWDRLENEKLKNELLHSSVVVAHLLDNIIKVRKALNRETALGTILADAGSIDNLRLLEKKTSYELVEFAAKYAFQDEVITLVDNDIYDSLKGEWGEICSTLGSIFLLHKVLQMSKPESILPLDIPDFKNTDRLDDIFNNLFAKVQKFANENPKHFVALAGVLRSEELKELELILHTPTEEQEVPDISNAIAIIDARKEAKAIKERAINTKEIYNSAKRYFDRLNSLRT